MFNFLQKGKTNNLLFVTPPFFQQTRKEEKLETDSGKSYRLAFLKQFRQVLPKSEQTNNILF